MAEDTIERVKLELGKKVAAVNRKAALILEISRLRLEAGNLRGEIAQTERKKEALVAQAAMEAYDRWKAGEEFLEELEKAFSQARELEEENQERENDILCLEKTSRELHALKNNEDLCKEEELEKEPEKEAGTKKESEEEAETKAERQEPRFCCPRCKAVYARKVNFCRRCGAPVSSGNCPDSQDPDIQDQDRQNQDSQEQSGKEQSSPN